MLPASARSRRKIPGGGQISRHRTADATRPHGSAEITSSAHRGRNISRRTRPVMSAAATQAPRAVSQGAQYVTILLGANDLCTASPDTMTSTATFQTEFQAAMAKLTAGAAEGARLRQQHPQPLPTVAGAAHQLTGAMGVGDGPHLRGDARCHTD